MDSLFLRLCAKGIAKKILICHINSIKRPFVFIDSCMRNMYNFKLNKMLAEKSSASSRQSSAFFFHSKRILSTSLASVNNHLMHTQFHNIIY